MKNNIFKYLGLAILSVLVMYSCVKEDFDAPPPYEGPVVETNATVADILALHQPGEFVTITDNYVFDAIVIADDSSGNYYKTLILQDDDESILKGIEVKINSTNLFNLYPIGRKLYIHAKGMIISDYNGLVQIGASTYIDDNGNTRLGGIEETLLDDYITKGPKDQYITPRKGGINDFSIDKDQNTLVTLTDVQFAPSDTGLLYTDQLRTTNRTIIDCDGNSIVARTSNFAEFSADPIPNGKGNITGIFSSFGTDKQFFIRRTSDVKLDGSRCNQTIEGTPISIQTLRSVFPVAPKGNVFTGIVISDRTTGHITPLNVVVQGESGYGITVRFKDDHTINLGDKISISTNNGELSEFKGLMQFGNVPLSDMIVVSQGNSVDPTELTVSEVLQDFERYESTLVLIDDVEITKSGGNDFVFVTNVSDASGSIDMFTSPSANFANESLPTKEVNMTAIVSQGGNDEAMQVGIRSLDDLEGYEGGGGGGGGDATIPFNEEFNSGIPSGWTIENTVGTRNWEGRDFDDEFYVQMSAFSSSGTVEAVAWLITPKFDFDAQSGEVLEIELADAFENGNPLKLMYSTDYSGSGNPDAATWTEFGADKISPLINNSGQYDNIYESSGPIDLSMINGTGYLAFVYDSNSATISTTVQLSTVDIK